MIAITGCYAKPSPPSRADCSNRQIPHTEKEMAMEGSYMLTPSESEQCFENRYKAYEADKEYEKEHSGQK
jgi:hypothetical protein